MEKQVITEEMKIHEAWFKEAKSMTLEKLPGFLKHLTEDYVHDYGTIVHALGAGAVATAWALNNSPAGGITGFQASCVMWDFIQNWFYSGNKCGLRLLDMDNLLYPQYEYKFKTIPGEMFAAIQEEAKKRIDTARHVHPDVYQHWLNIVAGEIPFGLEIEEE